MRGRLESPGLPSLERSLERRGLVLVDADEVRRESALELRRPGARRRELLEATRSLAALLGAGLPLSRAVGITRSVQEGSIRSTLERIGRRLERGDRVADAFGEEEGWFPPFYIGVLRAGAVSGDLVGAFERLADHLEREEELRGRIVSSLVYPGLLALFGGASVLVILFFVVPRFAELIADAGARLPTSTAVLVGTAEVLRANWSALLIGTMAAIVSVAAGLRSEFGRHTSSRLALALPVVGPLRRELLAARFARLANVLLRGGAPVLGALDGAARGIGDAGAEAEVDRVRIRVREGEQLHVALSKGDLFPDLLIRLVAVGEESGRLAEFLGKAADVFERRVERMLGRLVVLLEPAMIVVFGGVVAVVALALLQAIYGVNAGAFQ